MHRRESYDKELAAELQDSEFAKNTQIPYESVCPMLESDNTPKVATLDRYFGFFGLKVKISLEDVA